MNEVAPANSRAFAIHDNETGKLLGFIYVSEPEKTTGDCLVRSIPEQDNLAGTPDIQKLHDMGELSWAAVEGKIELSKDNGVVAEVIINVLKIGGKTFNLSDLNNENDRKKREMTGFLGMIASLGLFFFHRI